MTVPDKPAFRGYKFVQTCPACPEQYDVFDPDGKPAGYVRLRQGRLDRRYPGPEGETVYSAGIGDGFTGCFEDDGRRDLYLARCARAIIKHVNHKND